jgi:hypothetical protein
MRQDEKLLIQAVRETALGTVSEEVDIFLKSLERPFEDATNLLHLFARNVDTTIFNNEKLDQLNEEGKIYKALKNTGSQKYLK